MAQAVAPSPPSSPDSSKHPFTCGDIPAVLGDGRAAASDEQCRGRDPTPWSAPTTAPSPKTCSITLTLEAAPTLHGPQGLQFPPAARSPGPGLPGSASDVPPTKVPCRTLLLHIQAPAVAAADRGGLESSCGLTCQCLPPGSRRLLSSAPRSQPSCRGCKTLLLGPCRATPAQPEKAPPLALACPPAPDWAGGSEP